MSREESNFDWSPLGEEWWAEAKATCGGTWEQARFACGRHSRNLTMVRAAREAGYSGDDDSIRQAGSRAAKTTAVLAMLAMAAAESGGGDDGNVSRAEAKKILSRLARHSDPNVRIKAIESLSKLEAQDLEERAAASGKEPTGEEIVAAILMLGDWGRGAVMGLYQGEVERNGPRLDLAAGLPLFRELAPALSREFPDTWAAILSKLDADCRADAERLAAGPIVSINGLTRPKRVQVNGAGNGADADAGG